MKASVMEVQHKFAYVEFVPVVTVDISLCNNLKMLDKQHHSYDCILCFVFSTYLFIAK